MDKYNVDGWGSSWHREKSKEEENIARAKIREKLQRKLKKEEELNKRINEELGILGEYFIKDGCLGDVQEYKHSQSKIMFITKEAYTNTEAKQQIDDGKDEEAKTLLKKNIIDITKDYYDPNINTFYWKRIQQWAYGILKTKKDEIADFKDEKRIKKDDNGNNIINVESDLFKYTKNIAVVNLKKSNGISSTDYELLKKYVIPEDDKDFVRIDYKNKLLNQIKELEPNVIVCCGVLDIINDEKMYHNDIEKKGGRIYQWNYDKGNGKKATLIDYVHPSFPILSDDILFYGLVAIYQKSLDLK